MIAEPDNYKLQENWKEYKTTLVRPGTFGPLWFLILVAWTV